MNKLRIPLSPAWKASLMVGLPARLVLTGWGALSFLLGVPPAVMQAREIYTYGIPPIVDGFSGALWGVWQRWDAYYYISIAQTGYANNDFSVFFPLFPLLAKGISALTGLSALPALSLISLLAALLCFELLYQITAQFSPRLALPAVLMLACFPSAFFLWAPYPQSLGLGLTLLSIWAALRRKWLTAAAAGVAAGLTHSTTLPLVAALGTIALSQQWARIQPRLPQGISTRLTPFFTLTPAPGGKTNPLALLAALAPLTGTGAFLLWRSLQGFPDFSTLLLERWQRSPQPPWMPLLRLPQLFQSETFLAAGWSNLLVFLLACVATVWAVKRLPGWLWSFQVVGLVMLLSQDMTSEVLWGFNRYALLLFPIFIALAAWTDARPRLRFYLLVVMALMQLSLCLLHMQWVWVG